MRHVLTALALCASVTSAQADTTFTRTDGFVMGAGRWTCGEVLQMAKDGTPLEWGQVVGWILGAWSIASFAREEAFTNTVETTGGKQIVSITLGQCQQNDPRTALHDVVRSMIGNTNSGG